MVLHLLQPVLHFTLSVLNLEALAEALLFGNVSKHSLKLDAI